MSSKKRSSRSSSSKAKDSASGWEYPDYYNNPPFFTLQPVAETRQRQLSMWIDLIRDYCKAHKVFIMDPGHPIFNNSGIKRKLNDDGARAVLEALVKGGYGEWDGKKKERCTVFWRRPSEWARMLYSWAMDKGSTDTVLTFYEIVNSDGDFKDLDEEVLKRALAILEKEGKATVFDSSGSLGVKFFAT